MANDHQQQGENVSWVRRNFSCMNGINYPSMRVVYLDDVKELGLKLLYPDSFVHASSRNSTKTWVNLGWNAL